MNDALPTAAIASVTRPMNAGWDADWATADIRMHDVVIIGGGPAGLAAALALYRLGVTDILILEREKETGGILRQCIHDGFGLLRFAESLSGPEYAARFSTEVANRGIDCQVDTSVLAITPDKKILAVSRSGLAVYQARAIILAMGCRERTREAIRIPGTRPAGVFTAGVAQAYVNLKNIMIGRQVVILGSGDIGLIMARRLTLEGATVQAVFEIQPHPSGLPRNIEQCLNDFQIPLYLSHTVTEIHGRSRLTGVTVSAVDARLCPIPGTECRYDCDTLIISVGLIPENELSIQAGVELDPRTRGPRVDEFGQTSVPGIFAAGNVLHVHDLVDFVSLEAERVASSIRQYLEQTALPVSRILIAADDLIGYTVPQAVNGDTDFTLSLRVRQPVRNCRLTLIQGDRLVQTVRLAKAIPAEMIQVPVQAADLAGSERLVVHVTAD